MMDNIKKFAARNKITYRIVFFFFCALEWVRSVCFLMIRLFIPIQNNKIVFCTANGKRYGDNPLYISDEMVTLSENIEIVWIMSDLSIEMPPGIRKVKYGFLNSLKELSSAKVWVDSNMKRPGVLKRKGQLYIQTWHGSYGLKKIYADLGDKLPLVDKYECKSNIKKIDIMISNSQRTSEIYRNAFGYQGKILEYGSPKNDIFFADNSKYIKKVRDHFNIHNKKIVLYAPTFRNDYRTEDLNLDYDCLIKALKKRFGGEWVVLVRLHPSNARDAEKFIEYDDRIMNASAYGVMQELLVASDILITDYSSCMFDFATSRKPCFLFATDLERYRQERNNYYQLDELPFLIAKNNDEMRESVLAFDDKVYASKLDILFKQVKLNETGEASKLVAKYIVDWMEIN